MVLYFVSLNSPLVSYYFSRVTVEASFLIWIGCGVLYSMCRVGWSCSVFAVVRDLVPSFLYPQVSFVHANVLYAANTGNDYNYHIEKRWRAIYVLSIFCVTKTCSSVAMPSGYKLGITRACGHLTDAWYILKSWKTKFLNIIYSSQNYAITYMARCVQCECAYNNTYMYYIVGTVDSGSVGGQTASIRVVIW